MSSEPEKSRPVPTKNLQLLSYYVRQEDWKPTVPRGPVAAMYDSPGPAIVNLPTMMGDERHDPTKIKAPSYKMGVRLDKDVLNAGPGPAAYDTRGWTNKGVDRCPAPKMGIRLSDLTSQRTPGPADYSRSVGDKTVFQKPPAFTMRSRLKESTLHTTPGPNQYNIPSVLGNLGYTIYANKAPGYSMGLKLAGALTPQPGPGPANYVMPSPNVYKAAPPSYTIPKATKYEGTFKGPGPLAYKAELVTFNKYSTPKCTFGIKHSQYKCYPEFAAEK